MPASSNDNQPLAPRETLEFLANASHAQAAAILDHLRTDPVVIPRLIALARLIDAAASHHDLSNDSVCALLDRLPMPLVMSHIDTVEGFGALVDYVGIANGGDLISSYRATVH